MDAWVRVASGELCGNVGATRSLPLIVTMQLRYRRWKPTVVFPILILAAWLMRGQPREDTSYLIGMGLLVVLGAWYLAEELYWIFRNQGRPCEHCGQKLRLKPFSLWVRCGACGRVE